MPISVLAGTTVTTTSAFDVWVQQNILVEDAVSAAAAAQAKATMRNAQISAGLQILFQACPFLNSSKQTAGGKTTQKVKETAQDVDDIMWKMHEDRGYTYDDLDEDTARQVGGDIQATLGDKCSMFMNQEGKVGPWGSWALMKIKDKPDSFGENVPSDIGQWCPNYKKMTPSQRELFWVWAMMAMASSEATCNPDAKNPNAPNGTAMGLFQLEPRVCPKAKNLYRASDNITCAVDLLADELKDRDSLMTPTSKGKTGTYWGPLRSDDWNKARGGDISGAQKTRAIMKKYRYCGGAENPHEEDNQQAANGATPGDTAAASKSTKSKTDSSKKQQQRKPATKKVTQPELI